MKKTINEIESIVRDDITLNLNNINPKYRFLCVAAANQLMHLPNDIKLLNNPFEVYNENQKFVKETAAELYKSRKDYEFIKEKTIEECLSRGLKITKKDFEDNCDGEMAISYLTKLVGYDMVFLTVLASIYRKKIKLPIDLFKEVSAENNIKFCKNFATKTYIDGVRIDICGTFKPNFTLPQFVRDSI